MSAASLPAAAHAARPWHIHEIASDFRLEDVWALPTPGGPEDFGRLVGGITSLDPFRSSAASGFLFALRERLGALFKWDEERTGLGSRVAPLRERLPADLRDGPPPPDSELLPFVPLYMTEDEWAAEIANETVHGVIHLGWVPDDGGTYHGQMAILVKPNGLLGSAYLAAIKPFRHLLVYPALMRQIEREWREGD